MWHGAKNLGKKLTKVALIKGNDGLKEWLKDITNHFFHCAETCNEDVFIVKKKWIAVVNHVTNVHSWWLGQCDHEPLDEAEREKQWLRAGSKVVQALENAVTEKRLLNTFPYYVICQTTCELESFNNHVLMYAPKRNAFSYTVYKCRCYLAAIDYTMHLDRPQAIAKDGNQRFRGMYSKAASNWTAVPVKTPKKYSYTADLTQIAEEYCTENPLRFQVLLEASDPQHIASTIARAPPPPTQKIAADKKKV